MCTFKNNPKTRLPKKVKVVVWKLFGRHSTSSQPNSLMGDNFELGWNKWDVVRGASTHQSGFQVFARKKDVLKYVRGYPDYYACSVTIYAKNIVKATSDFTNNSPSRDYKVYEVTSFAIWKKDWEKRKKTV